MRVRGYLLVGAVGLAGLVSPGSAAACSCASYTPEEALEDGSRAVIAKLVDVRTDSQNDFRAKFVYRIKRVLQGPDRLRERLTVKIQS